ncbi:MAG: hypothetical protein ACM33B_09335 [Pseudomonadota bacterium]
MNYHASSIDELDACFVACEEAYVRLRTRDAPRNGSLGNALLLAAATSTLASESLSAEPDGRGAVLLDITATACAACAEACERDGAHWLAAAREACLAAAAACREVAQGRVSNGD